MKHFLQSLFFLLLVISCGENSPEIDDSVVTYDLTVKSTEEVFLVLEDLLNQDLMFQLQ